MGSFSNILILTDDPEVRGTLTDESAPTPTAAADAVVLDLDTSPVISISSRVRQTRQQYPDVPILVTARQATAARVVEAMRAGADDWLERPFDPQTVQAAFDAAEERRTLARDRAEMLRTLEEHGRQVEDDRRLLTRRLAEMGEELQAAHAQLQSRVSQLVMLYRIGRNLSQHRNWDEALEQFLESLCGFLEAPGAGIFLAHRRQVRPRSVYGLTPLLLDQLTQRLSAAAAPANDDLLPLEELFSEIPTRCQDRTAPWSHTLVPLRYRETHLGYLVLERPYLSAADLEPDLYFLITIQTILTEEVAGAQAVTELRELQHFHERTLDHVANGIISLDQDGRLLYSNLRSKALLGEVARGDSLDARVRVGGERIPLGHWLSRVTDGPARVAEGWVETPDAQTIPLSIVASRLSTEVPGEHQHVVVLEDLRARRELEAERRRAARQDELLIMAAEWAHDVRTPLTGILHSAELLCDAVPRSSGKHRHFTVIQDEVERIDGLVTNFLDFARPVEVKPVRVGLDELAAAVVDLMRGPAADVGVGLEMRRDAGPVPAVHIDVSQMKQVVLNLVTNAIDASPEGGRVTVRIGSDDAVDAPDWGAETTAAVLEVEDQGAGVAPDHIDRLFIPFFTTKPKGSGLGLAISDKVVRAHDGHLRYQRRDGATVLRVLLPRASSRPEQDGAVRTPPMKARG